MRNWLIFLAILITLIPVAHGDSSEDLRKELRWINQSVRGLWEEKEKNPEAYDGCMKALEKLEQQADQMQPGFLENILILKANTYQRTGRHKEAISEYQRMVDEFPNSKYTIQRKRKIRDISLLIDKEAAPVVAEIEPENPYLEDPLKEISTIMSSASSLYEF